MIVSIHIPKTAGTSFGAALGEVLGERLLDDYDDRPMARTPEDEARRRANADAVDPAHLTARYDAIHGHFLASKYASLGENWQLATFVREPMARTRSHFLHWRRHGHLPNPLAAEIASGRLDLAGFASRPGVADTYALFLDGVPLERFSFIGLTEEYDTSLRLFEAIFGIRLAARGENVAEDAEAEEPLDSADIRTAQAANIVIYEEAMRRFETLCRRYL